MVASAQHRDGGCMIAAQPAKLKPCKACKSLFMPARPLARVCSPHCAKVVVDANNAKKAKLLESANRKETRAKLKKLKTRGEWIKDAQVAFNAFIRARDTGKPCICCGRIGSGMVRGGEIDAGHYRSRGSAPHLRFDERNVHAQLKQCNRYASGNVVGYRLGLIQRLGLEVVEALESDQEPRRHTIEDLKQIKKTYAAKAKALLKEAQA